MVNVKVQQLERELKVIRVHTECVVMPAFVRMRMTMKAVYVAPSQWST